MPPSCREVVELLVSQGRARAAGRLCVSAVEQGPQQAEAVRQVALHLLATGSEEAAAAVAAAFWQEAGAADADVPAAAAMSPAPGPAGQGAASSLEEAAASELTAGMAALGVGGSSARGPAPGGAEPASEAPAATSIPAGTAVAAPAAAATAADLQAAAAVVLAAAVIEAVQQGHTGSVVGVTERLLAAGQQELLHNLVTAMVEAGAGAGWLFAGMLSCLRSARQPAIASSKLSPTRAAWQGTAARQARCRWPPWRLASTRWWKRWRVRRQALGTGHSAVLGLGELPRLPCTAAAELLCLLAHPFTHSPIPTRFSRAAGG